MVAAPVVADVVGGGDVGAGAWGMAIEDMDGLAELASGLPELRANPAAVPPALTIATDAIAATAANLRPANSSPSPDGIPVPSRHAPASMGAIHERPVMAM